MTIQSPFLPSTNIQFAWDSTSLGYIKTCPQLYKYILIDGWEAKDTSVHLTFGIHFHKALEVYEHFRLSADHEEALQLTIGDLLINAKDYNPNPETSKAAKYKSKPNLIALTIDYLDHFNKDQPDPAKTHILENGKPAVELSFRFELDWGPKGDGTGVWDGNIQMVQPYLLCGHLDKIVNFQDSLFVLDHKTTTATPGPYYFQNFEPDNQMTLYTIASQIVIGSPVKGVIIDAAQILLEKPNHFQRGFTYRTPDQLTEWINDLTYWLSLAETFATEGYWPKNDKSCSMYGGCKFREVCSKSPNVREAYLKADFIKLEPEERWNPLKER